MLKMIHDRVLAFDIEWVPDPVAGRLLHDLPDDLPDAAVLAEMWRRGGATEEDPRPFLKTVLCRVVSVAAVYRRVRGGEVSVSLMSRPNQPDDPVESNEANVIGRFLEWLGKTEPQLVGYNSVEADLKILLQRAIVLGIRADRFAARPRKPWEGRDYFVRDNDFHCDMKQLVGGFGRATPALHEIAVQSGIPGKFGIDGSQVAEAWLDGGLRRIVAYNECDALTTYLVWLRLAHFSGHFDADRYAREQELVRELLRSESATPGREHLADYLEEWDRLAGRLGRLRP